MLEWRFETASARVVASFRSLRGVQRPRHDADIRDVRLLQRIHHSGKSAKGNGFVSANINRSVSIPDCRMGAVSMKMTSSTSITSTKGVTLISESEVCVVPLGLVKAIGKQAFFRQQEQFHLSGRLCEISLRHIQKLQGKFIQHAPKFFDALKVMIVSNHGGDGGKEAGRSGD